jgi:hypothetical protein
MKNKYYSTHIKQNKCMRQNIFKPHNEKYEKVLGWFLAPHPRGNDPTLTIFDGWRDLNPPKVYTKYENNPGGGDGGGGRDQNQSIPDFVRGYNYQ